MPPILIEHVAWFFHDTILLCMGIAMLAADLRSPTSRALSVGLIMMGSGIIPMLALQLLGVWPLEHWWPTSLPIVGFSIIAFSEWFRLVLRTIPIRDRLARAAEWCLRFCQLVQLIAGIVLLISADEIAAGFQQGKSLSEIDTHGVPLRPMFVLAELSFALPMVVMLLRKPDLQERLRVMGVVAALPFVIAAELSDSETLFFLLRVIGVMVALIFVLQYHVTQGHRAQFLARFLSPEVEARVTATGLMNALHQTQREISVVCCDLRGFTAFSQSVAATDVAAVLRDYYNTVSAVVSEFGATIKDVAGDGVLILVGAPIPIIDHAPQALAIAEKILVRVEPIVRNWSRPETPLGLGIGVASGRVVAGVIDAAFRLEYAAVGPAVNLASRLCGKATDGQILVSRRTRELSGDPRLVETPTPGMKGLGDEQSGFALPSSG